MVFESDDWGSFRFKNEQIRDRYIKDEKSSGWMHYNDCFESYEDLKSLSDILHSVKDINQKPASFTFLMNPANPDFDKIEADHFEKYHYESFDQTLSKRHDGHYIKNWYNQAINDHLVEIGFHGREHLNVKAWMQSLQSKDKETLDGFKNRIWGQAVLKGVKTKIAHRSTFDIQSYKELSDLKIDIQEGVQLMNDIFKVNTTYFLPPDGPYHLDLNKALVDTGIKYIGLSKKHKNPLEKKWYQTKLFWLGKQSPEGLRIITRNVTFEPSSPKHKDWVRC